MGNILSEIITLLVSGITDFAAGLGEGISALAQSIFLEVGVNGATTLSTFGGLIVVFAAISLTIGLSRLIFRWVSSFGH